MEKRTQRAEFGKGTDGVLASSNLRMRIKKRAKSWHLMSPPISDMHVRQEIDIAFLAQFPGESLQPWR